MTLFSMVLPFMGAALYIRNEMMLAIALPPMSGAAVTLAVVCGLEPTNHLVLFLAAFGFSFAALSWMGSVQLSIIKRQILLASFFVGGSVLTHLLISVSSHAHAHLSFLLSGELLSLGYSEFFQSLILCLMSVIVVFAFRNAVFSYCIDEEIMRLRTHHFALFSVIYRLFVTLIISAGVLFIGPLLTSALLIFPVLLADGKNRSIQSFFVVGVLLGIAGATSGFVTGVATDIPPAYTASLGILICGFALKAGLGSIALGKKRAR